MHSGLPLLVSLDLIMACQTQFALSFPLKLGVTAFTLGLDLRMALVDAARHQKERTECHLSIAMRW